MTADERPFAGTYVGLFLVTSSTLMLEIALTRIFSVTMWYHFAFVAISVALFGLTAGALIVHLLPHRFPRAGVHRQLRAYALAFAVSIALCFAVQLAIPFTPHLSVGGVASVVGTCIVISIPFVFSGIVVCLALTRFPARVNRLYAVDLIGAGVGCVALVLLFSWFDGPSLVVFVAALAAAGSLAFGAGTARRRAIAQSAAVAVLLGCFAVVNVVRHDAGHPLLRIQWAKEARDPGHDYERWNAFSRLTVDGDPDDPDRPLLDLVIDSTAGTFLGRWSGDLSETDFHRDQVQNMVHFIRPDGDVYVIGMGGGRDVVSALEFEQQSVTAAEINGDIIDITNDTFGEYTGQLDEHPDVTIVNDDARSYLARTDRAFDLIQISLIDTWAATSAGAFALTENSLYTTEAWELFLDRLTPSGVLSVTRFFQTTTPAGEAVEPIETYRTVALAAEVLDRRGVEDPRSHILIYTQPTSYGVELANVMVSEEPFTDADLSVLGQEAARRGFSPMLTPDFAGDTMLERLTAPGGPGPALDGVRADISPPTDDRPFFFQMADIGTFLDAAILRDDHTTRPVLILGGLAVVVLAMAAACVALPLLAGRQARQRREHRRDEVPFYTYFAGIGLGFLLIEVAQLQRLSIFLGHPTYGLTVSLFSVLVFSGLGSLLTERFLRTGDRRSQLAPLVALAAMVVAAGFLTPVVLRATGGWITPWRIAVAVALVAPLALVMGMPFVIGMRAASAQPDSPTAFLWGINGAASVCASVLGVVIALFFGISTAFWAGALAYAMAIVSMSLITARAVRRDDGGSGRLDDLVEQPTPDGQGGLVAEVQPVES